jgi:hypothetical protein
MAEAAKQAIGGPEKLNVVADAGYSNGEQAAQCETQGIVPHVPANRGVNNQGDGKLFDRTLFVYDEKTDTFRCPADKILTRKQILKHKKTVQYGGIGRRLLPVSAETAMYDRRSTLPQAPPARECAAAHESARDG